MALEILLASDIHNCPLLFRGRCWPQPVKLAVVVFLRKVTFCVCALESGCRSHQLNGARRNILKLKLPLNLLWRIAKSRGAPMGVLECPKLSVTLRVGRQSW
jgi:hypothetical protein